MPIRKITPILLIFCVLLPKATLAYVYEDFNDDGMDEGLVFNGTGDAYLSVTGGIASMFGSNGEASVMRTKERVYGAYNYSVRFSTDAGSWDDVGAGAEEPIPFIAYTYNAYKIGAQIYYNGYYGKLGVQLKYKAKNSTFYKWNFEEGRWVSGRDTTSWPLTYYADGMWIELQIIKSENGSYLLIMRDLAANLTVITTQVDDVSNATQPDILFAGRVYYGTKHSGGRRLLDYFMVERNLPSYVYSDFNETTVPSWLRVVNGSCTTRNSMLECVGNDSIFTAYVDTDTSSNVYGYANIAFSHTYAPEKNNNVALLLKCNEVSYKLGWYDSNLVMIFRRASESLERIASMRYVFKQNEFHNFSISYNSSTVSFFFDNMPLLFYNANNSNCMIGMEAGYGDVMLVDLISVSSRRNKTDLISTGSNDLDGDGITNLVELSHDLDPLSLDTDDDGINDTAELILLLNYSPIFVISSKNMRDEFLPMPVELFVNRSYLYRMPFSVVLENPSISDLEKYNSSHYLDFQENESYYESYAQMLPSYSKAVYARATKSRYNNTEYIVLQYWHHYLYNDFINRHEGDWEMVEILLNPTTLEPEYAIYAQHEDSYYHNGGEIRRWDEVMKNETHPYVFVARGSHASYFTAGKHFLLRNVPLLYDICYDIGDAVVLAYDNYSLIVMGDDVHQPWLKYAGRWGKVWMIQDTDMLGTNGPRGPAYHDEKWNAPASWGLKYLTRELPLQYIVVYLNGSSALVRDNLNRLVGFVNNTIVKEIPNTDVVSVRNKTLFVLPPLDPDRDNVGTLSLEPQTKSYTIITLDDEIHSMDVFVVNETNGLHLRFINVSKTPFENIILLVNQSGVYLETGNTSQIKLQLVENNTVVSSKNVSANGISYEAAFSALNLPDCEVNISIASVSCSLCEKGSKLKYKLRVTTDYEGEKEINVSYYTTNIYGKILFFRNTTFRDFVSRKTKSRELTLNFDNEVVFLHANITSSSCMLSEGSRTYDNKTVYIASLDNKVYGESDKSFVKIVDIDKAGASFGDIVKVRINASRGNERSYALYVYIESAVNGWDASEVYTVYLREKGKTYDLRLPIQIRPNCENRLKDGNYFLIAKLGSKGIAVDRRQIRLEGRNAALCKKVIYYSLSRNHMVNEESEDETEVARSDSDYVLNWILWNASLNCSYKNAPKNETLLTVNMVNPSNKTVGINLFYSTDADNYTHLANISLKEHEALNLNFTINTTLITSIRLKLSSSDGYESNQTVSCATSIYEEKDSLLQRTGAGDNSISSRLVSTTSKLFYRIRSAFISLIYMIFS